MKLNKSLMIISLVICMASFFPTVQAIEIQASTLAKSEISAPQEAFRYKQHINALHQKRSLIYNALCLSDDQIKEYETMVTGNSQLYETEFNKLIKESYTLKSLESAGAERQDIAAQKKIVKQIKSDIDELYKKENKAFKKCLTREQRSKYAMITKLERKDYKAVSHKKDYYKSNPKMQPFGNPKTN